MVNRHPEQTRRRLEQTASRLRSLVHPVARAPDRLLVSERTGRDGWDAAQRLTYRPAAVGEAFGPQWSTYWFRIEATIPAEWAGRRVDLIWDSHSEATLWRDGRPLQGLNSGWRAQRTAAPLTTSAQGGERMAVAVEMACNAWMGDERPPPTGDPLGEARWRLGRTWHEPVDDRSPHAEFVYARLERCAIALFDEEAWALAFDFETLRQLEAEHARGLDPAWAGLLLAELNRFCNEWDAGDRASWTPARHVLRGLLAHRTAGRVHGVVALGHAHLDTAWLWPLAESRRKMVRTVANQLALMERYPEHRFAASSAQHYAWLEEDAPDLYARVRERVREGRWEVVGGAWVEPDCNLPSGESLVRQLLYGQRSFEQRFGRRCTTYWSPDTFGHNGQMPQILRGAGIERFVTQKLSWNQFTRPPHHSFCWQGIDGSRVLVHMPPADTYNAEMTVAELRASAARFKDHDRTATSLLLFGYGDGGGGPTPEMLEVARRVGDLQGAPRVALDTSESFFDRLTVELADPPLIVGELYFEYHRGTYTSQAATKRGNRRGERILHEAEAAAALAHRLGRAPYPADQLGALWRRLLLHQFHDILPGSSIRAVYEDAERDHAAVAEGGAALRDAAARALGAPGGDLAPLNLTPFARLEIADMPGGDVVTARAASYGFGTVVEAEDAVHVDRRPDAIVLQNRHLRATLDAGGRLLSLVEQSSGRESLSAPGNRFELYDDRPTAYDAWEIEPYHSETRRECAGAHHYAILSDGPLRVDVVFEHRLGDASALFQAVRLETHTRRLEFHTTVEWAERHRLLKVVFPVAVRSSTATYEMQFGVHERPTHVNTAADLARFEVPGHRFADLSEHRFGVALLTDSTYGYSTRGSEMRLSLLRGPTDPDPEADLGRHPFSYAVLPHAGTWQESGVVAEARCFNEPMHWVEHGGVGGGPLAAVDAPDLVLDTIKRAEDGDALIVRLYEAHGGRGTARISFGFPVREARLTTLLEEDGAELPLRDGVIEVAYSPFELITIAVR
jgi:alpha-mannosidase